MLELALALVPVLLFLAALQVMDSFKLVHARAVATALGVGAAAAAACGPLHAWLQPALGVDATTFIRYVAPMTEETLKAAFLLLLVARRRVGFLVDAAVQGFAIGAGFAVVENLGYLWALGDATPWLWLIRGLGTAMLHGGTTAIFGILTRAVADRAPDRPILAGVPGLAAAVAIHAAFNHVLLPPLAMTLLLLIALPLLVVVVFQRSEAATREWVVAGLDLDVELLNLVASDAFGHTRFGRYLQQLRAQFGGPVVVDMFCLLRLQLELSVQAKAMLMAREAGLDLPVDDDLAPALAELEHLRAAIGPTGLLALEPLQVSSHRDDWHRFLLTTARARRASTAGR
jgi:RsiW-degrading membrane proteinase PrsW (M82 family)